MKILRPRTGRRQNARLPYVNPIETAPGKFYVSREATDTLGSDYVLVYELDPAPDGRRLFGLRPTTSDDEFARRLSATGKDGKYRTLWASGMILDGKHYLSYDKESDLWVLTPEQPLRESN